MKVINFHKKKIEQIEAEMVELNEHMVKGNEYLVRLKAQISDISDNLRALYDEKEELENEFLNQVDQYAEFDHGK